MCIFTLVEKAATSTSAESPKPASTKSSEQAKAEEVPKKPAEPAEAKTSASPVTFDEIGGE